MIAYIVNAAGEVLAEQDLYRNDQDFEYLGGGGAGAMDIIIDNPGIPAFLLLVENGRVIAEGKFGRDITLSKEYHRKGEMMVIKLNFK